MGHEKIFHSRIKSQVLSSIAYHEGSNLLRPEWNSWDLNLKIAQGNENSEWIEEVSFNFGYSERRKKWPSLFKPNLRKYQVALSLFFTKCGVLSLSCSHCCYTCVLVLVPWSVYLFCKSKENFTELTEIQDKFYYLKTHCKIRNHINLHLLIRIYTCLLIMHHY